MNTKNLVIGIIVAVVLVVGVLFFSMPKTLGGLVHNTTEHFITGLIVGSAEQGGCIKIRNSDNNAWGYMYYNSALGTVTASTSSPFTGACGGQ
jgi:hypothetical protein